MRTTNLQISLLILSLLVGALAYGQNEHDSLDVLKSYARGDYAEMMRLGEQMLTEAEENDDQELRAQVLLEYANFNFFAGRMGEADSLYTIVVNLASPDLACTARVRKAFILSEIGETDAAGAGFLREIARCEQVGDTSNWAEALNGIANVMTDKYKIDSALYFYQVAMRLAEAANDVYKQAYLYNNIGLLKMDHDQEDGALEDFLKGVELTGEADDMRLLGHLSNNIALIYMSRNEYDSALTYFRVFLQSAIDNESPREIGMGYLNVGSVKLQLEEYDSAEFYVDSSLYYLFATGGVMYIPKGLAGLARVHVETGRFEEALLLADSAIAMAVDYGILHDQAFAHLVASQAYEGMNMLDSALARYKEFKWMNDSITDLTNEKVLNELNVIYDVEKKDAELEKKRNEVALLEAEQALSAFRWKVGIGIAGTLLVLGIILFILWRSRMMRQQQEKYSQQLLQSVEEERGRIARDLHDDIGQMLSSIKSKVHLQREKFQPDDMVQLEESLGEVIEKGRNISRALYPSYLRRLGLKEAVLGLVKQLEEDNDMVCTAEIDVIESELEPDQKLHIFRIVQECISNTLKHADAKSIRVDIAHDSNGISIQYRDNGKGIENKSDRAGMGLMSISDRVKLLGGELEFGSNSGKGFRLKVKVNG